MLVHKIPFENTGAFTPFFLDYIHQKGPLKPFYNRFASIVNFEGQIKEKSGSFSGENRKILVQALYRHYEGYDLTDSVKHNIQLLEDQKTFTVTTGHQLNIFSGPIYFIFKIVTVINTCKKLKEVYPQYNFVPVYWMASEDHDYDEIKSFRLYGKKYTWETNQTGAVGRFQTHDFKKLLPEIPGDIALFKNAYTKFNTLSSAVRYYVNALFGEEGLLVVDGDDRELKKLFTSVIADDLLEHSIKQQVDKTDSALEKIGYKTQVYCRDINFFYLEDGLRNRIEKSGDRFSVVDTSLSFTAPEIKKLIEQSPEKFSPNVILRPLYQEMILPNLAYIGGPAEVVYWLQLKGMFESYEIPFPILMPRNFGLVMDGPISRKFNKTGLELTDLFLEKNKLLNHAALKFSQNNIRLNGEKEALEKYFESIRQNAETVDKTLGPLVAAETKRAIRSLERIEQKLLKAEKRHQSDRLKQIEAVKDTLFPNGSLQERTDNFLNFYQQDPQFIQKLLQHLDPFDFRFNVFVYPF